MKFIKNFWKILKNPNWIWITLLLGLIVFGLLRISEVQFPNLPLSSGIVAFISAVIGVLLTAFAISVQLKQQSDAEAQKDKNVKIFEKKQEVYYDFLEKLKEIIQDGEIHIGTKNKDGSVNNSVDELKDLIFQFAYLQLHTSEETINGVVEKVSKLIQHLNDFGSTKEADKQKKLPEFYSSLSNEIFGITAILKKDLYNDDSKPISEDKMNQILRECDLFIETNDFNKYDIQKYFLDELRNLLTKKGYNINDKEYDFTLDISKYYAKARNRHIWYGFKFPVYKSEKLNMEIFWTIEIENDYYYGITRPEEGFENADIKECIPEGFGSTPWWFAWKFSDKYRLDFWNLNSKGFEELNSKKRDKFMQGIADEIDMYVKKFIQKAQQNNL